MMICEKCEKEMLGTVVHCSHCGHNHVLQRIDSWRERRSHQISSLRQDSKATSPTPPPVINGLRANAKSSTLIRFPKRPLPTSEPAAHPAAQNVESLPEWRQRLDARLKEIREQRAFGGAPVATSRVTPRVDRNPIVVSALNRIHRANYLQPITPQPHSRYAVATQLAPAPMVEVPNLASQPMHRLAEAQPVLPVTLRNLSAVPPVLEAVEEPELLLAEMPEDLLAEIVVEPTPKVEEKVSASGVTILEAASLAKRVAAAVIDAEIIAFSLLPLFAAYFFLGGWFEAPAIYTPIAVAIALIAAYFFVTYALAGRTMGMALMNLHLASQSATTDVAINTGPSTVTFTFQQAALRALGGTISLLLFPVNFICIAKSFERLSLSDYLSGTQVVKIKK